MTEPNHNQPITAEAAGAVASPPTPAEAADAPAPASPADSAMSDAGQGADDSQGAAPEATAELSQAPDVEPPPAAPPRPIWRAFGHALVHLLAVAALLFVLVGLAPRVERICAQMLYDDRSALTNFVFGVGYFVKKNWFLAPLVLLFDLGILWILRRSFDPALARNYTTIVVAISLLLSIVFGYGLIAPLGELLKRL